MKKMQINSKKIKQKSHKIYQITTPKSLPDKFIKRAFPAHQAKPVDS